MTVTVQDAPAFRVEPQGVLPPGTAVKYPLPLMLVMLMAEALTFLMVVVLELEVLRTMLPKLWLAGLNVNGDVGPFWPVPVIPPDAIGLLDPFGVMVSAPLISPLVVGVKLTATVHLALAFNVPLQGVEPVPTAE